MRLGCGPGGDTVLSDRICFPADNADSKPGAGFDVRIGAVLDNPSSVLQLGDMKEQVYSGTGIH